MELTKRDSIDDIQYSPQLLRDVIQKLRRKDGLVSASKLYYELCL